ncbi:hypothetical protein T4A_10482 [Trichinella pseudospiralis]|uniref:Uncharacterized protein n=1 Tax=Trichinella pseudospiralis TaxID=6337 RepID=A0A0V1DVF7_TRIPS|nr:hypothetical protein T4A_10482 [Trichinella pseudospiralis]
MTIVPEYHLRYTDTLNLKVERKMHEICRAFS